VHVCEILFTAYYQFSLGSVIVFTGDHFTASGIGFNASQLLRGTPWDIGVL
jgi:hypothetical protein